MPAKNIMKFWPLMINKTKTKDLQATYYFHLTGEENEDFALQIEQGKCVFIDGIPKDYSVKIITTSKLWLAVLNGSRDLEEVLKEKEVEVQGDLKLLIHFEDYFSGDPTGEYAPTIGYAKTENEEELEKGVWRKPERVLGIQASPSREKGGTEVIYSNLIEGMKEAGAQVETIYLNDLDIKICRGCLSCWYKKKECVYEDDGMRDIYDSLAGYDLMILAVPVYVDGMPGRVKNFIDRLVRMIEGAFILKDDHCRHPAKHPRMPHLVLIGTCGFHELDNFQPMIDHVAALCKNLHITHIATVLRTAAWLLKVKPLAEYFEPSLNAARTAGKKVIETGKVPEAIQKTIERPLFTRGQLLAIYNSEQ